MTLRASWAGKTEFNYRLSAHVVAHAKIHVLITWPVVLQGGTSLINQGASTSSGITAEMLEEPQRQDSALHPLIQVLNHDTLQLRY